MALNTPTVFNASLNFRVNWEGNVRSLEEGVENSLRNPVIMASSIDEVVSKLRADPEMVRELRASRKISTGFSFMRGASARATASSTRW